MATYQLYFSQRVVWRSLVIFLIIFIQSNYGLFIFKFTEILKLSHYTINVYLFISSFIYVYRKLKKEAELQQLEEEEEAEAFTKMWSFCIKGQDFFVVLYLAPCKIHCLVDQVYFWNRYIKYSEEELFSK